MKSNPEKLRAGATVKCNDKNGVIGAIINYNDKICALTVYHLIKAAKCTLDSEFSLNGFKGSISKILDDLDLVIIESDASSDESEISNLGRPRIGSAYALNGTKKNSCNVMTVGKTYHYLSFSHRSIPLPGDSGSPIIQNRKVVGILSSVFFNNAAGIAVSVENFI
ncbi:MAG: hypothetical protein KO217_04175 [Methanobacteriaceae archaeon]|jgi:hypothetical protein|nr:MAG: hypothetical protein CIT01_06705 [Methanobacterium sp. BRmetb2]MCC7557870.1 hypothetical protein [Methanobacteriaceae archaeon]